VIGGAQAGGVEVPAEDQVGVLVEVRPAARAVRELAKVIRDCP